MADVFTGATLESRDGTTIAYGTAASGPAVIVVNTVAEDRAALAGSPACSPSTTPRFRNTVN